MNDELPPSQATARLHEGRIIAFKVDYAALAESVAAGLFLSQLVYLSGRVKDKEGWFFHTADAIEFETTLTRRQQEGARVKLKELGVLEEWRRGVPAQLFFRIRYDILDAKIADLADMREPETKISQNGETGFTLHETADLDSMKGEILASSNVDSLPITRSITRSITRGNARAEKPRRAPAADDSIDQAFRDGLIERYGSTLGGAGRVQIAIDKATNAGGFRRARSKRAYVVNWLNDDASKVPPTTARGAGGNSRYTGSVRHPTTDWNDPATLAYARSIGAVGDID